MPASTPRWPSRPAAHRRPQRALSSDERAVSDVIGYILVFGILSAILVMSMLAFNVAQGAAKSRAIELRAESGAARVAGVVVQSALLAEQQGTSNLAVSYRIDLPDDLEGAAYTVVLEPAATRTTASDVVLVANSPTVTSASAAFTNADLGRSVTFAGGGGSLRSGATIAGVVSATKATLSTAALSSGTASIKISGPDQVAVVVPRLNLVVMQPVFSSGQSTTVKICPSTSPGGALRVVFDNPTKAVYTGLQPYPFLSTCPPAGSGVTAALFLEVAS